VLDEVHREVWNEARRQGHLELARELKGARFAVWKNSASAAAAPCDIHAEKGMRLATNAARGDGRTFTAIPQIP
jgi:hypothetical protein